MHKTPRETAIRELQASLSPRIFSKDACLCKRRYLLRWATVIPHPATHALRPVIHSVHNYNEEVSKFVLLKLNKIFQNNDIILRKTDIKNNFPIGSNIPQ